MKRFFVIFFVFFLMLVNSSILKAQDNIAFIDLNIIFDNSEAGKKITKEIESRKKKNSNNTKDLRKKFEDEKQKLITQKNVLSTEDFEKRLIKLENDMNEYNSKIQSKNNELAQFQINVRKEFFNKLRPILEDYAKENSIDIILKKENVLIGKTNLDISKSILDLFNKNVKKISVN